MPSRALRPRRIAYFAHSLRSDWNNGNAHFLRGLMRSLGRLGHQVTVFEPESGWSIDNLQREPRGADSLRDFAATYPDLNIETYTGHQPNGADLSMMDAVILHEWNPPALAQFLLDRRDALGFRLLFHDTHHRASSSPEQMQAFGLQRFDGILAFGESLRTIYKERYGITNAWTLHEAADVSVFKPQPDRPRTSGIVWIGNWGEGERSQEIRDYLLDPASSFGRECGTTIYGVRYPPEGLAALAKAEVRYGGYLPNLSAPGAYADARLTVHIPRQQYSAAMHGIPTIRVFEALACGIPLVSAPWQDSENLFRANDFCMVSRPSEMHDALATLLRDPSRAEAQAARGLQTVLTRHTCDHRAQELTNILEELLP